MHKSKKSENSGWYGRQNMLWPYLKIWDWELIFGCTVKAISSPGVRSPWVLLWYLKWSKAKESKYFKNRYKKQFLFFQSDCLWVESLKGSELVTWFFLLKYPPWIWLWPTYHRALFQIRLSNWLKNSTWWINWQNSAVISDRNSLNYYYDFFFRSPTRRTKGGSW